MLKKRFGQNLLTNKAILQQIAEATGAGKDDAVIEIGAGAGALTKELAALAARVFAFEIDRDFYPALEGMEKDYPGLELIKADFLNYDLENLLDGINGKAILAGNIPYNITTPIISKIFQKETLNKLKTIVIMTQLEYALRLTAGPSTKQYGSITLFVNYYADVEIVRKVSKGNFKPVPKVDSAVLKITPLSGPRYRCSEETLFKIIRASFSQRRKKIINSLANSGIAESKEKLLDIFKKAGISPDARAENLSMEDYVKLTQNFI
ncbi:MAG: 16S rRNA (adenine(1518)-N(6)/adenine(1519)-N(6))-dimethyltransferase RsmA [Armatimonadota bacterium]